MQEHGEEGFQILYRQLRYQPGKQLASLVVIILILSQLSLEL